MRRGVGVVAADIATADAARLWGVDVVVAMGPVCQGRLFSYIGHTVAPIGCRSRASAESRSILMTLGPTRCATRVPSDMRLRIVLWLGRSRLRLH
jgi:hypothetical protein